MLEACQIYAGHEHNKAPAKVNGCAGANIASDAEAVRRNLRELAGEQLPAQLQAGGRTEVLPVQWRKHLNLEVSSACCLLSTVHPALVVTQILLLLYPPPYIRLPGRWLHFVP